MAEVAFRPARQLSEYKGKGASASREDSIKLLHAIAVQSRNSYVRYMRIPICCILKSPDGLAVGNEANCSTYCSGRETNIKYFVIYEVTMQN